MHPVMTDLSTQFHVDRWNWYFPFYCLIYDGNIDPPPHPPPYPRIKSGIFHETGSGLLTFKEAFGKINKTKICHVVIFFFFCPVLMEESPPLKNGLTQQTAIRLLMQSICSCFCPLIYDRSVPAIRGPETNLFLSSAYHM